MGKSGVHSQHHCRKKYFLIASKHAANKKGLGYVQTKNRCVLCLDVQHNSTTKVPTVGKYLQRTTLCLTAVKTFPEERSC